MLQVNGLLIRRIAPADVDRYADDFLAIRNDVDAALMNLSRPRGQGVDDIKRWIDTRNAEENCLLLGIFTDDRFVGYALFRTECAVSGVGELGLAINKDHRGMGYGGAVIGVLVDHILGALGYRKITARILRNNPASIRLFESHGFKKVGTMRKHWKVDGRFEDLYLFERFEEPAENSG